VNRSIRYIAIRSALAQIGNDWRKAHANKAAN
jgi:hypothetical protein